MNSRTKRSHSFGSEWTDQKLAVVKGYLSAYTKVMSKQPFTTGYIDAFAGTGYRLHRCIPGSTDADQGTLFPDLAAAEPQALLDGSARVALQTEPRFDRYVFVELDPQRCDSLELLREEFPDLRDDIVVQRDEANVAVRRLCEKNWKNHRAVLFLDPYGMQVEWETLEAVAGTQAIDLWLLFPLGIGVNRLVTRSGEIPEAWQRRLDCLLGTPAWRDEFYRMERTADLFDDEAERVVKASMETIGRYFVERLKMLFPGVSESPGVLRNSRGCPLYLLCFAAGNPKGAKIALKIADHLLRKLN